MVEDASSRERRFLVVRYAHFPRNDREAARNDRRGGWNEGSNCPE